MEETKSDFILAIDAGQSETSCLIGLQDGTLLGTGLGGPGSVPDDEQALPMTHLALSTSVNQALDAIHPRPDNISAAYLSLTGGIDVAPKILAELIPIERIKAESDAVAALACGSFGGPGIALLSGTGCVAYIQDARGNGKVIGGWGYLLGDEGSGIWIGLEAVRAAIHAEDGRGPATDFTRDVMNQLGVNDMRQAQVKIYNEVITRPEIARLSLLVSKFARANDPLAQDIILRAAQELFKLLKAACQTAGFTRSEEKVIVLTGGILRPNSLVFARLAEMIHVEFPDYRVISPSFPPVIGAFILGIILSGERITPETIARIETGLPRIPAHHLKI
jgi:glucosamine kinase